MSQKDIKEKINDLIDIDQGIKVLEIKKADLRKEILDFMLSKESNLLTIPNICRVFLQSKETFKNYPSDIQEMQNTLNIKMKEAELSGLAEKHITTFIKLELIKPKKESYVGE